MTGSHYVPHDVKAAVQAALDSLGAGDAPLCPEDTASLDEFHVRGREATRELAAQLDLGPGQRVLDLGCGIGGPSRHLAHTYGCHVTGLDLTAPYCEIADLIAKRLRLDSLLTYLHGDALAIPFPEDAFDAVWTQHASMNIADKARLYGEIRRVLKPGGLFAMYDALAGPVSSLHFPVPWAADASMSFLLSPEALQAILDQAGFEIIHWRDTTELGRNWFRQAAAGREARPSGRPPLGLHILMGPEIRVMSKNLIRNLEENRVLLTEVIAR